MRRDTTTSTTPPNVSPAFWHSATSACMARLASGSKQRTGSASIASRSPKPGTEPTARIGPSSTTWLTTVIPHACCRKLDATRPSATRAAVSRAEARSRIGRASSQSYFCIPARSA